MARYQKFRVIAPMGLIVPVGSMLRGVSEDMIARFKHCLEVLDEKQGRVEVQKPFTIIVGTEVEFKGDPEPIFRSGVVLVEDAEPEEEESPPPPDDPNTGKGEGGDDDPDAGNGEGGDDDPDAGNGEGGDDDPNAEAKPVE